MPLSAQDNALNEAELEAYRVLLSAAFESAVQFDGSEPSHHRLYQSLSDMEGFTRARNGGFMAVELEVAFAKAVMPHLDSSDLTVSGLLTKAAEFFKNAEKSKTEDLLRDLERSGAFVLREDKVLLMPGESPSKDWALKSEKSFEVRTAPRLSLLLEHLNRMGIYTDDLIIHVGSITPRMRRQHPYHLVQIPRLDREVAVCEQIGEVTFAGKAILGIDVWTNLTKKELKARSDVMVIPYFSTRQWLKELEAVLAGEVERKVSLPDYVRSKAPLDAELLEKTVLAFYYANDNNFPTIGSGPVEHGPYAGKAHWRNTVHEALYKGRVRGVEGKSSLAQFNKMVAKKHGLLYYNHLDQPDLDRDLITACIWQHYQNTGEWPTHETGKVLYGPYADWDITFQDFRNALERELRGLKGEDSLAKIKAELALEHGVPYENDKDKEPLKIEKIKECIWAYYCATINPVTGLGKMPTARSGIVQHGPYADKETWGGINTACHQKLRRLPAGYNLSRLNKIVAEEHGLVYHRGRITSNKEGLPALTRGNPPEI